MSGCVGVGVCAVPCMLVNKIMCTGGYSIRIISTIPIGLLLRWYYKFRNSLIFFSGLSTKLELMALGALAALGAESQKWR